MTAEQTKRVILGGAIVTVALVVVASVVTLKGARNSGSYGLSTVSQAPMIAGGSAGMPSPSGEMARDSYDYDMSVKSAIAPMPPVYEENGGQTAAEVDQKIIKSGSLRLTVDNVSDSLGQISDLAKKYGGFVQTSASSERGDGKHEGSIVIRVPAKDFESAIADAKKIAQIVNDEAISGQDVTEQYSDLEARLRNAQAQEAEYLLILKKAVTVEDILRVQPLLGQVRGEIESLQGRLKYLQNVTSFSNISISLSEEAEISLPTKEFRPLTVVKQAVQSLVTIGQDVVAALIWIVIVGGGLAIPAILLGLIIRALLRSRRKK